MKVAVIQFDRIVILSAILAITSLAQTSSPAPVETRVVVPAGSVWAYHHAEQPPFTGWKEVIYIESGWPTGAAPLGYGDGDERTVIRSSAAPHPITAYFRHAFLAPTNLPITKIRLMRDDGAVVYINGREVLRANMPDGEITHATVAASTTGADGENSYHEYSIVPVALLQTTNVVAVEVHQANAASSDLGFDLELIASVPEPPTTPIVSIQTLFDQTSEPLPNALVTPGRFEVHRWERDLTSPLRVDLAYEGSASSADYEPLPTSVTIAAGRSSVTFDVLPRSDDLFEETETVIAHIRQRSSLDPDPANRPYTLNPSRARAIVLIADEDTGSLPTVSIQNTFSAYEPQPGENKPPGYFGIAREGNTSSELSVHLRYEGTATPGVDYDALPQTITFAPNQQLVQVFVHARNDGIIEGDETVIAHLISPPIGGGSPGYVPSGNPGNLHIFDNGLTVPPSLAITEPRNGEFIRLGEPIKITAVATDPKGYISRVEFFANGAHIGGSEIVFIIPPPPGTPITHSIVWSNAPNGEHVLDALAKDSNGAIVASPEVRVIVATEQPRVLVSVRTIDGTAIEPSPNSNLADDAAFEITRTTGIQNELRVFFSMHGTAAEGSDYAELPESIVIPAGQLSATVKIAALPDALTVIEPVESVGIRLQPAPNMGPVPWYEIAAGKDEAGAVILDHPMQYRALVYVFPEQNEQFELNERTTLLVAAYHPTNRVLRVEFLLDGAIIGVSEIPPTDQWSGVFFHQLPWFASPAGQHRLTARAVLGFLGTVTSEPVDILIGSDPTVPVVSIRASQPNTSEPIPTAFIAPGVFEVSRLEGDRTLPLRVHLAYDGTASAADYEQLPAVVTIPGGESSVSFNVLAKSDDLVEGTETVVARIVPPVASDPAAGTEPPYDIDPERARAEVRIADEDTPPLPVVSLETVRAETPEMRPNFEAVPGRFRLHRTGSLERELSVLLRYEGTATPNTDYGKLPDTVTFKVGAATADLEVSGTEDELIEGTETVIAHLIYPPDATLLPGYIIDLNRNSGTVRIIDTTPTRVATLRITEPASGAIIRAGQPIKIAAVAVDPLGYIPRVEFFADGIRIGVSEITFIVAPEPGTPIHHEIVWSNAPAGEHVLVARAQDSRGNAIASPEVKIRVAEGTESVLVSVAATDRIATELPLDRSAIDTATFEISRSGPLDRELIVFFSLHGTARVEADYKPVGESVRIAAGQRSATVIITPVTDALTVVEPMETVGIRLEPSPNLGPVPWYEIMPGQGEAAAVIFEREPNPNAANIAFALPDENTRFELNQPTTLLVAAYHATQDATHVDFLLDGEKIGSSDVIVPPNEPGGLVVHRLEWKAAPAGQHQLKAVAVFANGLNMESPPLTIFIGSGNGSARIEITRPQSGQVFALGVPIEIDAVAVDPNGYIPRLEFYAGDRLIGVSEIVFIRAPDPGTPIHHSIVWSNAPAGEHVLTARGVDSNGQRVVSNGVRIFVGSAPARTVLAVEATDPTGSELGANGAIDPAVFRVRRVSGPTNQPVLFRFSLTGTAANGIDYERLEIQQTILAGQQAREIVIRPIPDKALEGTETVILKLIPSRCEEDPATGDTRPIAPIPDSYCVLGSGVAEAIIRDSSPDINLPPRVSFTVPRDGAVFEPGQPIFIGANGIDPDGRVVQMTLFAGDRLLWETNAPNLAFMWSNAPAGQHTLRVRATDNQNTQGTGSIRILVREANSSFVERDLPPNYVPGVALTVSLIATPPAGTRAWGVEDQPPRGWAVTEISHQGVFDPVTGKVKFGHFTEILNSQRLSYRVTPPANAAGDYEFSGTASADGRSFAITGDRVIRGGSQENHPADTTRDKRLALVELTAYAAAWKNGNSAETIPVSYVTRAALIWRNGETYHYVPASPAPNCWMPDAQELRAQATSSEPAAVRTCAAQTLPGAPFEVAISVPAQVGVSAYALEEHVPAGWMITNISDEGVFDAAAGVVRWGLFLDGNARTLRYSLSAPAGITTIADLRGEVSFDGDAEVIAGAARVVAAETSATLGLARCERDADGKIQLTLVGPASQICALEVSTDLQNWTMMEEVFLPDGELSFAGDSTAGAQQRFYRLRVR